MSVPRPPFPKTLRQFQADFATEGACQQYLAPVVGQMVSFALDADTGKPTSWSDGGSDNVQAVATKFR